MKILIFLISILSFSAFAQTVEQNIEILGQKKSEIDSFLDKTPYQNEQHSVMESYFQGMNKFALEVRDFSRSTTRFNNVVSRMGVSQFCNKVLLDLKRWEDLKQNCTRNGFFVCAEEVRSYDVAKNILKNKLNNKLKKEFEENGVCN